MASNEIYLRDVVILTTIATNKTNLGSALAEDIKNKKYPQNTTFCRNFELQKHPEIRFFFHGFFTFSTISLDISVVRS